MLHERIRKLRLAKGMTLQQVGDVFGISASSVSSWEKGINLPDSRKLSKLADLLGTSVELLIPESLDLRNQSGPGKSSGVPFVTWSELISWPDSKTLSDQFAYLLHQNPRESVFATRYPGSEQIRSTPQIPLAGSIVFFDTEKEISPGATVLLLDQNVPQIASCIRSEKGSVRFLQLGTTEEIKNPKVIIGGAIEWQISGKL
jgi:transcriptional regulator with XRE-family HTH domain